MRKVTATAKTVELAVLQALQRLKISRERAHVLVQRAPRTGFFGIGARDAQVEVSVVEDPVGDAERFLREVFVGMGLTVRLRHERSGENVVFHLSGDRVGLLIGKHGQTLDALQTLVNAVGNRLTERPLRFVVDAEGYREKRRQALILMANRLAEKALAIGREIVMEPMSSQERKVVHTALQGRTDVRTESRGTEPARSIVIVPVTAREGKRRLETSGGAGRKSAKA